MQMSIWLDVAQKDKVFFKPKKLKAYRKSIPVQAVIDGAQVF
jgi:hypothetical protein